MADPTLPPSLAAEIADLRRRLNNLERSQRLPFSSTRGGAFLFFDDSGNRRKAMGNVNLDGSIGGITTAYGEFEYGDGGAIALAVREGDRGIMYPEMEIPHHTPTSINVTSGSFLTLWESYQHFPAYEVVFVEMAVITDAGTSGEVRLFENGNNQATSVASVGAAFNGTVQFEWLHPAHTGLYDPRAQPSTNLLLAVQARRTGGAGNVIVFPPRHMRMTSKFIHPDAATDGHPVVI